jgi:hypothetical protein
MPRWEPGCAGGYEGFFVDTPKRTIDMTPDQFRELCRGASRALELSEPDALFEGADVRVDGAKLGVFHEDDWDAGIYCYADLGAIEPTANAAELMEEILALNLELDAGLGEVIGIERESRHLVLRARLAESGAPMHGGNWPSNFVAMRHLRMSFTRKSSSGLLVLHSRRLFVLSRSCDRARSSPRPKPVYCPSTVPSHPTMAVRDDASAHP